MSNITINVFFETCWTPCRNRTFRWSRTKFTFFWSTPYCWKKYWGKWFILMLQHILRTIVRSAQKSPFFPLRFLLTNFEPANDFWQMAAISGVPWLLFFRWRVDNAICSPTDERMHALVLLRNRTQARTYVRREECTQASMHGCTHVRTQTHTESRTQAPTRTQECRYEFTCKLTHARSHAWMHTRTHRRKDTRAAWHAETPAPIMHAFKHCFERKHARPPAPKMP